jgi:hypothetical protein
MLTGLKVMAIAQKDLGIKRMDELFLRCDYRVLADEEMDATYLFENYARPLPAKVKEFAMKHHKRCLDAGLTCKPKIHNLEFHFFYFQGNKEICSFYASINSGYRIIIKGLKMAQYADVIETFSLPLQEKIAKGYGCDVKKFGEPCQNGCHGFSFPLDESVLKIAGELEMWLGQELALLS